MKIHESVDFLTITFLTDEGEYVALWASSINTSTCLAEKPILMAEETAWEHGYKESFSILEQSGIIRKITRTGSRDWGDYTKWARDSVESRFRFDARGALKAESN